MLFFKVVFLFMWSVSFLFVFSVLFLFVLFRFALQATVTFFLGMQLTIVCSMKHVYGKRFFSFRCGTLFSHKWRVTFVDVRVFVLLFFKRKPNYQQLLRLPHSGRKGVQVIADVV